MKLLRRANLEHLVDFPVCLKQVLLFDSFSKENLLTIPLKVELHLKIYLTRFRCSETFHQHPKLKNAMETAEARGLLFNLNHKSPIVEYLLRSAEYIERDHEEDLL